MKKNKNQPSGDRINFVSDDGQVEVVTKIESARRFPQHGYPVVCLRLRPKPGSRIQMLNDGSGGLDVLFRHPEIKAHLLALNEADPKADYRAKDVPAKPRARKEHYDRINAQRWKKKRCR